MLAVHRFLVAPGAGPLIALILSDAGRIQAAKVDGRAGWRFRRIRAPGHVHGHRPWLGE
jgi:hypothetical protein